jgi:LacI family transcriptional regulator
MLNRLSFFSKNEGKKIASMKKMSSIQVLADRRAAPGGGVIAMLVEGIADPFFADIARIIGERAGDHGYKIFYSNTGNDENVTRELIRVYRDTQVDAYIIAPPPGIEQEIGELLGAGIPVVLFDRYFDGLPTSNVIVDNFNGSMLAVEHLLQNGHRNIGFITIDSAQTQMTSRLQGYYRAMQHHTLETSILKLGFGLDPAIAAHEIKAFLRQHPQLQAILFATNYLAISGLHAIAALQRTVPGDLAVVGFDDTPYFSLFSPSITAVAQPVRAISQKVIDNLIDCLTGRTPVLPQQTTILPVELIIRQSSAPRVKSDTSKL